MSLFIHFSFTEETFVMHLLCAKHCASAEDEMGVGGGKQEGNKKGE